MNRELFGRIPGGAAGAGSGRPGGWPRALLFASGDFACNLYWQSISLYLLFYYTEVVGLAPEAAGLVYLAGSLWDGVAGLLVGIVADRPGPGRPRLQAWMVLGSVPLALSFLLLYWAPPLRGAALVAAALFAHLLFRTLYAMVNVPYAALSVQVAASGAERSRIAGLRMIFGAAAAALVATATQRIASLVTGRVDGAGGFFAAAALFAAIATALLILVGLRVRPRGQAAAHASAGIGTALRSIGRNRAFLILNLAMFAAVVGITMVTKGTLYYFKYRIGHEGAAGGALALMGVAGVLFVPLWMAVAARWGARAQWFATIGCGAAALLGFALADVASVRAMTIFLICFQAAITGFSFGFWAMLPDTVEHGERASGVRVQVLLFGLAALLQKFALGLAATLVGLFLGLAGYVANIPQGPQALASLTRSMTLVPLIALGLSGLAMAFHPGAVVEAPEAG
ncbi:MAG: glucuronide carrier protein [Sphingomonadales bacterium]|nr:glucuronide carrier protein [Sphingomonadales bacterium]